MFNLELPELETGELVKADKEKLDIFGKVLPALDRRDINFYNNLTDDEKKKYIALIIMRFMSSSPNKNDSHLVSLLEVNEYVNTNFWELTKYPDLQHLLLTLCGQGGKIFHKWISGIKKNKNSSKLFDLLKRKYKNMNSIEYEIIIKQFDKKSLKEFCLDFALNDKDIKEILKEFNQNEM